MRKPWRHGRLSVAGRSVVGKSWSVVERAGSAKGVVWETVAGGAVAKLGWVTGKGSAAGWETRAVDSGAPVEAERQTRSRDLVGAAMCVARASAAPRVGAVAGLDRVGAGGSVGAVGADVDDASLVFTHLSTLLDPRSP
jgi:hypothetical protein